MALVLVPKAHIFAICNRVRRVAEKIEHRSDCFCTYKVVTDTHSGQKSHIEVTSIVRANREFTGNKITFQFNVRKL